jgi:glycosyltransferase involved in cell wall biosynthesis
LDKKINILYISHSPFINGAEIVLLNILENIDRNKFLPFVLFPGNGPLVETVKSLGIQIFITDLERWIRFSFEKPLKNSNLRERVRRIEDIIIRYDIDIVHTNSSVVLEGALAAMLSNRPHVWHIHEFLSNYKELQSFLPYSIVFKIINYLSTVIVTVSHYTSKQFEQIAPAGKIVTVYNGVKENLDIKKNAELNTDKNFGPNLKQIVAVTIGLLTENKGYNEFLEAALIIKNKNINIKFYWVGNFIAEDLKKFRSKVNRLKLNETVFFNGFSNNISKVLSDADILICASRNEALPMVILEAMASKVPVITTDCGGTTEAVEDGISGFVIPVNDPIALSSKILELYEDDSKRLEFGKKGFSLYEDKFDIKVIMRKIESLYLDIIKNQKIQAIAKLDKSDIVSLFSYYDKLSNEHWKSLR